MTKELLAQALTGRQYGSEITVEEELIARGNLLVVFFGDSDDLCEIRGFINDEITVRNGTPILIDKNCRLLPEMEREDVVVLSKHRVLHIVNGLRLGALVVTPIWCQEPNLPWTFKSTAPYVTFDILDGTDVFCRGIVIDLKENFPNAE